MPALSGLAKKFEKMLGDTYVAGLWQSELPTELLWYPWKEPASHKDISLPTPVYRTSSYVAPSWSWASNISCIWGIRDRDLQSARANVYFIDTLEVNTKPVSDDHTGQLEGGFIRLLGILQHVRRVPPFSCQDFRLFDVVMKDVQSGSGTRNSSGSSIGSHECSDASGEDELFFLPICRIESTYQTYHGLLLQETPNPGTFQRVVAADVLDTSSFRYEYHHTAEVPYRWGGVGLEIVKHLGKK